MANEYVNPKYRELVDNVYRILTDENGNLTMANCSNCSGTGRHIYVDSDGTMKDIPCQACHGSGQAPE